MERGVYSLFKMQWNEFQAHVRHLTTANQKRVERAFLLGARVHRGQKRSSGEPFFSHPIAVAHMLADIEADADTIIAALLHDSIEDTELTLVDIEREFGKEVTALIDGVTKLTAAELAKPSLNEQIETLRKMFLLMQEDIRIMVIKLYDRLHNIQTAEFLEPARQLVLAQETMDIYVKIADRLSMQDLRNELEGLSLAILEPELRGKLQDLRVRAEQEGELAIRKMRYAFGSSHEALLKEVDMLFEPRPWEKVRRQHETDGMVVTGIATTTVVFACKERNDCYRLLGALHELWQREVMSFQDYINAPMINGYQGLHTTVILQGGSRIRCKIRTREMQEYAHRGITTFCFGKQKKRSLEGLPWMQRITPLSADTAERSDEFWESLKSDILGDSMMIHGPGDQAVLLPKNATALDGAFYLFGEEALRTEVILVNGREVPLQTSLKHADSIEIKLGEKQKVVLQWLDWVQTGIAGAKIRSAISVSLSPEQKVAVGKHMLQTVLHEKHHGFIEEFEEAVLLPKLQPLGYFSLQEAFVALADGRMKPKQLYDSLFGPVLPVAPLEERRRLCIARFSVPRDDTETLEWQLSIYERYRMHQKKLRLLPIPYTRTIRIFWHLLLTEQEETLLKQDIARAGGLDIEIVVRSHGEILLMGTVIGLWALNPVLASWFLHHGMPALTLITLRLLTFAFFSISFYALWRAVRPIRIARAEHLHWFASIPAVGLIGMTVFNYLALEWVAPSVHLTILRLNILLLGLLAMIKRKQLRRSWLMMSFLFLACIFALTAGNPVPWGISMSVLALLSYTFYSLVSEHILQERKISVRYPLFLFSMGLYLGVAGLLLVTLQSLSDFQTPLVLPAILYILVCVCLPHACYSALLKRTRFTHFTHLFLTEVPLAVFFEFAILGVLLPPLLYIVIAVILALLFLQSRKGLSPVSET